MRETIAAISTPRAAGGIGMLRISGKEARMVADQVFRSLSHRSLMDMKGYTCTYGHVTDKEGHILDEAIATVFLSPKSYTGEDVVELSCHGGLYTTQRVLRAVLDSGAVPASPGEFTKRAFLNGKIGLTEAESVMDIIGAQGEASARLAMAARQGALSNRIRDILNTLIHAAAHLSAWVDFPDEDIPEIEDSALSGVLRDAAQNLTALIDTFDVGRILREGVDTVIIGRPNVGKSMLMNLLSGTEKSIVTPVAGTTRDIVEETVRLGDIVLRLADTAGIRATDNEVERIGVDRARDRIRSAGLILAVFDSSEPLTEDDFSLIQSLDQNHTIAIINKSDLPKKIDEPYIINHFKHFVTISSVRGEGVEELSSMIADLLSVSNLREDDGILATERQRNAAVHAREAVESAYTDLLAGITLDAVNVSLDEAIASLLSLTGERVTDTVVNDVFAQFCVGK